MHIYSFNDLKFTLKHLKRSYVFRSYDRPQGAYIVLGVVVVVVEFCLLGTNYLYRCTVHSVVYLINTPTNVHILI